MYESNRAESIRRIAELLRGIRTAMLVTRGGDGTLRARPMATQDLDFDGTLWFFTVNPSNKIGELTHEPEVVVTYEDSSRHRYLSLSGRAELVQDAERARVLWTPGHREWLPNGLEDPDVTLLKIEVSRAEYWDSPGMLGTLGNVFAGFTGHPPAPGENRQESVRHGTVRL